MDCCDSVGVVKRQIEARIVVAVPVQQKTVSSAEETRVVTTAIGNRHSGNGVERGERPRRARAHVIGDRRAFESSRYSVLTY